MRNDELDRLLRDAHGPAAGADRTHRDELRRELVARHRRQYPRRQRWKIMTHRTWFRPALAMFAMAALGIAACTAPTEYEVEMGKQVNVSFDGLAKSADLDTRLEELSAWVEGRDGVDGVWIGLEEVAGGPATAELTVWGQGLDSETLRADLVAAFPDLAGATIEISDLTGTAQGSIAEAMGHNLLHLEVAGETAEEVRQNILAALAAEGVEGEVNVFVDDSDGERRVEIHLEDMQVPEDADAETSDGLTIEL